MPREREEQRDCVFGRSGGIACGRVDDDDASATGSLNIDVIHAHASPRDHAQAFARREYIGGYACLAAHDEAIARAHRREQIITAQTRTHLDIRERAQNRDTFLRDRVRYEHAGALVIPRHRRTSLILSFHTNLSTLKKSMMPRTRSHPPIPA
jgi:hypothetical protein